MNILYAMRADYETRMGGDSIQMINTKKFIERLYTNVRITIITRPKEIEQYKDADVLHIFNMQDFALALAFATKAHKLRIKVVLSTIYWNLLDSIYVNRVLSHIPNMRVLNVLSIFKRPLTLNTPHKQYGGYIYKNRGRKLLCYVDAILPNSKEEGEIVSGFFGDTGYDIFVVPNAITEIEDNGVIVEKYNKFKDCILMAARVQTYKNQLGVLEAERDSNYPLVFAGKYDEEDRYYKKLKALAEKRGNVYFLGEITQQELLSLYKLAKVHVLPSFRESPGLSSLEALRFGCNIVVSNNKHCPVEYYLFDKVGYVCNPYFAASIHSQITKAYNDELKEIPDNYFEMFSYNAVAKHTVEAYIKVLQKNVQ